MGLNWYCYHAGRKERSIHHDVWIQWFPYVEEILVDQAYDGPDTDQLIQWLFDNDYSVFSHNMERRPGAGIHTTFYFPDKKIARAFRLVHDVPRQMFAPYLMMKENRVLKGQLST